MQTAVLAKKPPSATQRIRPPLPRGVHAKLKLGGAHDEAEKQADRIAAKALSKSPPSTSQSFGADQDARSAIRRALAPVDGSEKLAAPIEDEQALPENLEREIATLQSGGQPLPPPLRSEMEARFGLDLSAVRIHTDPNAAELNEVLHAHAFSVGEHIAFNAGRYQPETGAGRFLLAHELAHVAQQRGEAGRVEATPVRRGFWGDLYDSATSTLGDIANWAADQVASVGWQIIEAISPDFARSLRAIQSEGILSWLGRQIARAWDAYIATLRALVPFEGPRQLIDLFAGLVERAARIAAALASGDCQPLMAAIGELKTFVTETAGVAWNRLTEFLQPIGQFFTDLWTGFGAPAVQWLQEFGGDIWQWIQDLGQSFWAWIAPVREAASRIWSWFSELLFGASEDESGSSQGGVLGWVTRKAGEAWDWVKERTRPVWQPVAEFAGKVAELIPPAFIREMGEHTQQLSTELDSATADMNGGEGVPQSRDTLASVLPSVEAILATVRRIIVGAGQWLGERITAIGGLVSSLITGLRGSDLLSWLAGAFNWLAEAVETLASWARDKVTVLFNWLVQGFDALTPFLQMVMETVRKVISIYADLFSLPLLLAQGLWQRVPACIREPVERFIKEQILARIPVFGQFFSDPELWPRVQQTALDILRRIFVDGDLRGAAWAFFQAVLRILGLPPELVVQVLAKAARAIGDILTNPIGFLINLLRTVGAGFMSFFSNIGTHLLTGFTGWLFSTVREAGINPPADFSLRSVLGFVMDVLGVTVEKVFERLARKLDPAIVARLRSMLAVATGVWSFVATLVTEGPAGLWRELSERLSGLWDTVVQGVVGFITERVIGWASRWLVSLLDVSGIMPVINTLIAIYRAIESFMQYLRQMLEIVSRVLDGIISIARGSIAEAAIFMENALASALPVAIGFLANQAGLGRLSERLREILGSLRERVEAAIDWLIDRALRAGRAVIDMVKRGVSAVKSAASRLGAWAGQLLGLSKSFKAKNGESHKLFFKEKGDSLALMMASDEDTYEHHLQKITVTAGSDNEKKKKRAIACAKEIDALIASRRRTATDQSGTRDQTPEFNAKLQELSDLTRDILSEESGGPLPVTPVPEYGGLQGGFATRMRVHPLTRLGVPGTNVQVDHPIYRALLKRTETVDGRSYYIAGHLLNNNVHGSGTTWANLTPISQGTNQKHERDVESKVKKAADAGAILDYTVTVDYGRNQTKNAALLREILGHTDASGTLPPDLAIKKEVLEAEQSLPKQLTCTLRKIDVDGKADSSFSDAMNNYPVTNEIQEDRLDQYLVSGANYDANSELASLSADARDALQATPTLTWTAYRQGRGSRIDRLKESKPDGEKHIGKLQNIFRDHHLVRLLTAEQSAIAALAEMMTWAEFTRNRAAYDKSRAEDERLSSGQIDSLENAFVSRRDNLREQRTQALEGIANSLGKHEKWGDFRLREKIFKSEGGLTESQVERVRSAFEIRMANLPATAQAGSGQTSATPAKTKQP